MPASPVAAIAYDAGRGSLYDPGAATDFFQYGPYTSDAALCAELSRLAYVASPAAMESFLDRGGLSLYQFVEKDGTEAVLAGDGQRTVLAFRGTESRDPRDLVTDLDFTRIPWPQGGAVHRGFARALELVWPTIAPLLQSVGAGLLFAGHSLGGALATLAASRRAPGGLYTFGSPRVGDAAFAESMDAAGVHRRYVNCCDLVPQVPPEPLGFRHCGELRYIDQTGVLPRLMERGPIKSDQQAARLAYVKHVAWRTGCVTLRDLADHAMFNYLSAVLGRRGATVIAGDRGPIAD